MAAWLLQFPSPTSAAGPDHRLHLERPSAAEARQKRARPRRGGSMSFSVVGIRDFWHGHIAAAFACIFLASCQTDNNLVTGSLGPNSARTIAFESVDGPPQAVFQRLVAQLSADAEARKLPVVSRTSAAAWRVRLYLAAHVQRKQATVTWVGDVYDARYNRAFRISGEEVISPSRKDVWALVDDAVLARIASKSLDAIIAQMSGTDLPTSPPPTSEPRDDSQPVASLPPTRSAAFIGPRE